MLSENFVVRKRLKTISKNNIQPLVREKIEKSSSEKESNNRTTYLYNLKKSKSNLLFLRLYKLYTRYINISVKYLNK